MKNIYKLVVILVIATVFGCEQYEGAYPDLSETYPAYVEIPNSSAITVPEGGIATINLSSRVVIAEAYTISYEVSGAFTAVGSLDVEAGNSMAELTVPVDAGIVTEEAVTATVTLTSITNGMAIGRNGIGESVDLIITKFVPFVAANYAVTFDCDEPDYAVYPITFVVTSDPLVLTNTNFWDSGWSIDYTFSGDFEQTVTIVPQTVGTGDDARTVSGSGSYDGVTQTIVVDYTVVDGNGGVRDDNTHTFTLPV